MFSGAGLEDLWLSNVERDLADDVSLKSCSWPVESREGVQLVVDDVEAEDLVKG